MYGYIEMVLAVSLAKGPEKDTYYYVLIVCAVVGAITGIAEALKGKRK